MRGFTLAVCATLGWSARASPHSRPRDTETEIVYPLADLMLNSEVDFVEGFRQFGGLKHFLEVSEYIAKPVDSLKGEVKIDLEGYITACANECRKDVECYAFTIAYYEDPSTNECALLYNGNIYRVCRQGDENTAEPPYTDDRYLMVFVEETKECPSGQFYGHSEGGSFYNSCFQLLGCYNKLSDGALCNELGSHDFYHVHEGFLEAFPEHGEKSQVCSSGVCTPYGDSLDEDISLCGTKESLKTLQGQRDVAYPSEFDELLAGEYTVQDFKTLRSNPAIGNVGFYIDSSDLDDMNKITDFEDVDSADAYSALCAARCAEDSDCWVYTIVWTKVNPEKNACYLIPDDGLFLYTMPRQRFGNPEFIGLLFVPKDNAPELGVNMRFSFRHTEDWLAYERVMTVRNKFEGLAETLHMIRLGYFRD